MNYTDIITGDLEGFSKSIKLSFNISLDQIPIEILRRGRGSIVSYLSSFLPSFQEEMKETALEYLNKYNIRLLK